MTDTRIEISNPTADHKTMKETLTTLSDLVEDFSNKHGINLNDIIISMKGDLQNFIDR
jgi:hypothetical protein